ncbi:hypothetical protein SHANETTE_27 [Bacillus phage Shanette]|nr:hypothetical protein AVV46_gp027 [Bacillus phage Shanette]AGR46932.1 hypothetical protein SHANETTE_27 [Bacillus phage Shanette]
MSGYPLESCKDCIHEKMCKFIAVFNEMKSSGVPVDYDDPELCTLFEASGGDGTPTGDFLSGLLKNHPDVQVMYMDDFFSQSAKQASDSAVRNHLNKTDPDVAIKQMNEQLLKAIREYQVQEGVDPDKVKFNPETLEMVGLDTLSYYQVPGFGSLDTEYDDDMELGMFWLGHTEEDEEEED